MALPVAGYEYESDALADGLVAYWPMFDKYTTNIVSDIVGGRNLSVVNDALDASAVDAILGLARDLTINGTGELHAMLHRNANAADTETYDDWTFGIWFNLDSLTTANNPHIVDFTSDRGFKAYFDYPGSVDTFYITFTDAATIFSSTSMPTTAADHLLLITCDSATTTITAYLDNVQIGQDTADSQVFAPWSGQMFIGDTSTLATSTDYLDGIVDEMFVFNRAVDATERGYIWNTGAGLELVSYANSERVIVDDFIGFDDFTDFSFEAVAIDIIGFTSNAVGNLTLLASATDALALNSAFVLSKDAVVSVSDAIQFSDSATINSTVGAIAYDTISFIAGLNVDGDTYVGVVMNTESNAVTEYTDFSFNSMTRAGTNEYLAARADGIYTLGGDLDDTNAIDAHLTTKLFDFGSPQFKRMDRAYLGIKNDGSMILKVVTRDSSDGTKHENWYEMENTSEEMRTQRVKTGKGLKSHYWQFTLANKDGGDFDLDTIEFKPIILSRRV